MIAEPQSRSVDYMPMDLGDVPTWVGALVASMSLILGAISGAVGSAWRAGERFRLLEQRLGDKLAEHEQRTASRYDMLRDRQDELHRENKQDLHRLEDRLLTQAYCANFERTDKAPR